MLTLLLSLTAQAADDGPNWTVTVDPLTFAIGYAHVQVERKLSGSTSLYAGPHMRLFNGLLTDEPEPFLGFGAEVGFRWFPLKKAPEGPWLMARTVGARLHTTDGSEQASFGGYSSALVGYTGLIGPLVLSGGAGFNYLYYTVGDYGPSGPFVALHTNIGVAF